LSCDALQIAGGSAIGRDHVLSGRNNQDALVWRQDPGGEPLVAVVADGCGGTPHGEVGAQLCARLLAAAALSRLRAGAAPDDPATWAAVGEEVLDRLRPLVAPAGGPAAVHDLFLCTLVGLALSGDLLVAFHGGDGVICVDGARWLDGAAADGAPAYLGYRLLDPAAPGLRLAGVAARAEVAWVAVGSDGAAGLDLAALAADELVFRNRDGLRRRLARAALADDATLILVRRRCRS
jgi:protein phosphatase 2C-like protein